MVEPHRVRELQPTHGDIVPIIFVWGSMNHFLVCSVLLATSGHDLCLLCICGFISIFLINRPFSKRRHTFGNLNNKQTFLLKGMNILLVMENMQGLLIHKLFFSTVLSCHLSGKTFVIAYCLLFFSLFKKIQIAVLCDEVQ